MLNQVTSGASKGPALVPSAPFSFVKHRPPSTTVVFDTYWRFAAERQEILFRRIRGDAAPWTTDPVLATYKFTNAYRAADRVSQHLIRSVIYRRSCVVQDTVFRILLFKIFNKIETWHLLEETYGELNARAFDVHAFDRTLEACLDAGATIYSAAYIMPSGPATVRRPRKHRTHLELLACILRDRLPERLAESRSMAEAYALLRALPGIGPFLAYQYAIDLNYSDHLNFSEMEFVVPGPGARDGMRKCFRDLGDYSEADAIRWVADRQEEEFLKRGLSFRSLGGRPLQLIDCQNLFCEVDKYARVQHPEIAGRSGRLRIKQKFAPKSALPPLWFPPKWDINHAAPASQPTTGPSLL
jgi:hypothetical protein